MVQPREEAPEPARDARGPCDDGKCLHSAPLLEVRDAPDGNLLEAHDVGAVVADDVEHLLEERVPTRRERVPVEDVPGADDERQAGMVRATSAAAEGVRPRE